MNIHVFDFSYLHVHNIRTYGKRLVFFRLRILFFLLSQFLLIHFAFETLRLFNSLFCFLFQLMWLVKIHFSILSFILVDRNVVDKIHILIRFYNVSSTERILSLKEITHECLRVNLCELYSFNKFLWEFCRIYTLGLNTDNTFRFRLYTYIHENVGNMFKLSHEGIRIVCKQNGLSL